MSMNTQSASTPANPLPPRRRHGRVLAALLTAGLLSTSMIGFAASHGTGDAHGAANGHPGPQAALDDAHLRQLVHHLADIGSVEQKTQFMDIAKAAVADLNGFEQQARQARGRRLQLLLRDTIDRAALERTRQEEMQVVDQRSRRVDRLLIDLAAVLTPQQRAQMSAHVQASAG